MAKNEKRIFLKILLSEDWPLFIAGFIVLIMSIAHLLGFLEHFKWLAENIPKIILLLLGAITLFIVRVLKKIESSIHALEIRKEGVKVLQFENIAEVYYYVANRLLSAKKCIDDITWGSYTGYRTEEEQKAYEVYVSTIEKVCKKGNIMYREISSLSDKHYFDRAINLFAHYSYHLAYHDVSCVNVPLISYVIFDSKEVVLGFSRVPGHVQPLDRIIYLSIEDPLIVKFFSDYYESIWYKAEKIKEAKFIDQEKVNQIKAQLALGN